MRTALRHHLEHFILRRNQLFASGWGFVEGARVEKVVLRLRYMDHSVVDIDGEYGRQREDIGFRFPEFPDATHAGFMFLSGVSGKPLESASMIWSGADETIFETRLALPGRRGRYRLRAAFDVYKNLIARAFTLLVASGVAPVAAKIRRYLAGRPKALDGWDWNRLKTRLAGKSITLMVDHDMGGGANLYRDQVIRERVGQDMAVLLLSFHVASLQYFIELFDSGSRLRLSIDDANLILPLLNGHGVQELVYNCAVSFPEPLSIIDTLLAAKHQSSGRLIVTVHDYFAICPSHFLIDHQGSFCGVPELARCQTCLPLHKDGFVSMTGVRDVVHWRAQWARLLAGADEVRAFSIAARRLMERAFPEANHSCWTVVPHRLHTKMEEVAVSPGAGLHIGVVGAIGRHKGANVLEALATEIVRRNSPVRISVIGTLEAKAPPSVVRVTGPYQPGELADRVRGSEANVFLFPSVWAETFSYVAHELVSMGVPFACFDFGAPADLARQYDRGLVLKSREPARLLDELENFWRTLYQRNL